MPIVLVTGANGHVGSQLVAHLTEKGYRVRALVRRPEEARRDVVELQHPAVEVVAGDIRDEAAVKAAVAGCDGVFQVAAVYAVHASDPQRDIIDPAVNGTLNVLRAAKAAGVRRVVLTSSQVAVGNSAPPSKPLTEKDWNDASTEPYAVAKTRSERKAWEFAKEAGLDLVCVNPSVIIGPGFLRHTPSTQLFENALRGLMPMLLPLGFTLVDVRDVAIAHRLAFEVASASGRYLVGNVTLPMREIFESMNRADEKIKVPALTMPAFLLPTLPLMDWLQSKLLGTTRMMTREAVAEYAAGSPHLSTAKIRRELKWDARPVDESVADTLAWIKAKRVKA